MDLLYRIRMNQDFDEYRALDHATTRHLATVTRKARLPDPIELTMAKAPRTRSDHCVQSIEGSNAGMRTASRKSA